MTHESLRSMLPDRSPEDFENSLLEVGNELGLSAVALSDPARQANGARRQGGPMSETRDIILYGDLPEPLYVLRIPVSGVRWSKLMQAARRLVKKLAGVPPHKAAPHWNIDGDPPKWDPVKWHSYEYRVEQDDFERVITEEV